MRCKCGRQRPEALVNHGVSCEVCGWTPVGEYEVPAGPPLPPRRHKGAGWAGKLPKGPNGRNLCRWCGTEVKPPRLTFCSDACVHEWKVRSQPAYARKQVAARDRGVCRSCGVDTEAWQRAFNVARKEARKLGCMGQIALDGAWSLVHERWRSLRQLMRDAGRIDGRGHWWEMDHVLEVVNGGGSCGLDNLQTLCIRCHKAKTATLAASRRAAP